jgi:hypothetical protein
MGLAMAPTRDGKVMPPDAFEALPESDRKTLQHQMEALQAELEIAMRQVPQREREHREAVRDLNRKVSGFAIGHLMAELRAAYADLPDTAAYIDSVERDVKENFDDFLPQPAAQTGSPLPRCGQSRGRERAVSPVSGQCHRRQWRQDRRAGHLRR